jgi:hypothetical protein
VPSKIAKTEAANGFPLEDSFKYTPLGQLRVLYIGFVQGLFYLRSPGQYRWTPDETSEIVVTDENPIKLSTIGMRPAVSFVRGPVQAYSLGFDDMLEYDPATGKKTKAILVPGTMSINVCSRVAAESENLAWVIGEHLWLFREELMQHGFFEVGRQFVVGSPSPPGSLMEGDSAQEWYCTSVQSPFQFYRTSAKTPLNKTIIDTINMNLFSKMSALRSGTAPSADGMPEVPFSRDASPPASRFVNPELELRRAPHPLNPAQEVVIRPVRSNRSGLRPPSLRGRLLPITVEGVEESDAPVTDRTTTIKV